VPFSSARKWSSVTADGRGTWVFGAPEMVLPAPVGPAQQSARAGADTLAAEGRRVLLLARSDEPPGTVGDEATLPEALTPAALVILAERVRDDAADTLRYFTEQGVALKVISGDNPRTVGAVAAHVGVPPPMPSTPEPCRPTWPSWPPCSRTTACSDGSRRSRSAPWWPPCRARATWWR
jgi:cation-transporting ATPase E